MRVLDHAQPRAPIDRLREAVDVEGGRRDHRQEIAVAWIHHDDRARVPLHRPFRGLLNATVHGGDHLRARARLALLDQAHGAAHRVDLDTLAAVLPAQVLVEQPLEAALADHLAAPVPALFELVVARLADVPEQVRGEAAGRVHALRLDLGDHARELELPLLHLRDVLQREAATHANGQERVGLHAGDRVLELPVGDAQERGHAAQHRVAALRVARQLTGDQGERERRAVVDERRAVAVEQDAARRRDRADPDPVPVRGVEEASALQHLEVPELPDDDDERHRDQDGHRHDALLHGVAAPWHPVAAEDAAHERRLRTPGRAGTRST